MKNKKIVMLLSLVNLTILASCGGSNSSINKESSSSSVKESSSNFLKDSNNAIDLFASSKKKFHNNSIPYR